MDETAIQYVSDANGEATGVIVPIALWRELTSETETAYLLKNEAMRTRLIDARNRKGGIPFEVAREKLGI
jgi:hypothetical protein